MSGVVARERPGPAALDADACLAVLTGARVARIAWRASVGLTVLPVSCTWFDHQVVLRTRTDALLAELAEPSDVAVEVEDLDPVRRRGRVVLVRGRSRTLDPEHDAELAAVVADLTPWVGGRPTLTLAVSAETVSGRRFGAPEPDAPRTEGEVDPDLQLWWSRRDRIAELDPW